MKEVDLLILLMYTKGNVVKNAFSIRGKRVQDSKAENDVKNWIKTLRDNKTI